MTIRRKVIALLGGLFLVLGALQFIVGRTILLPGFAELERRDAATDMERAANAVAHDLDLISAMAADWGDWDQVYRFMQDHDRQFIASSMTTSTIAGYRANAVAFVDLSGTFTWARAIDFETGGTIDLDVIERGRLPPGHAWLGALRTGTAASGLLRTNHGPMLAAFVPILDGAHHGPHRGMVLLGRLLTGKEIARIGRQGQVHLSARLIGAGGAPAIETHAVDGLHDNERLVVHAGVTEVNRTLMDIDQAPLLTLHIEVPRSISARGETVVTYAWLMLVCSGAVALAFLVLVLNRTVLDPLATLTHDVVRMGRSDDLTTRLGLQRDDELGALAREFDQMVDHLEEARHQVVDRSFLAGIAENASGVLHNLGNALTPLCLRVATLQESLRHAPTGDIELVLAQLAQSTDPARRADLESFLRLTSSELAQHVKAVQANIEELDATTQGILALLAEQTRHSRAPAALEALQLVDVVRQGTALVSPRLLQRLSVETDSSLASVGTICTARTILQQVIQNLLVNAAEATRGPGPGRMRIAARIVPAAGGDTLQLQFSDDGHGIAPEHLGRVFERGFSTKSSATNAGIGLHWCANALNALGGSLGVESPGIDRGATFLVVLPLVRPDDQRMNQAA